MKVKQSSKKHMTHGCLSQAEIIERLETSGVNATAQRIAIGKYVLSEAEHPTADDVKLWADKNFPKMSLATVYNTLNILVEAKLLKEFKFPHTGKVVYDSNITKHHHFYDEDTGIVSDIPLDQVEVLTKLKRTYNITDIEVVIRGSRRR
jgi:Fur family iron response transcriptional regulator